MVEVAPSRFQYSIHGQAVDLTCSVASALEAMDRALGEFVVTVPSGGGIGAINGSIRPYNADEIVKHLSSSATRLAGTSDLIEIYQEDERFWLINDRWGLCELNLIKGQFRTWVLGKRAVISDSDAIVEQAMMWPLSQLLRPRGLSLLPAAGVVRDGWGVLLLSAFSIEPELRALTRAGWKLIGQSWVALREERGNVLMLTMPGMVEKSSTMSGAAILKSEISRVDLAAEFYGCRADRAGLDAVLLVAPGRRPVSELRHVMPTNALGALRRDWPIAELHPHRRHGQLMTRIAQRCSVFDVQLSRNARDILAIVEMAKNHRSIKPRVSVYVTSRVRQIA